VHAPVGESVSLRLVGRVRNVRPAEFGRGLRVGVEFDDLSETEEAILRVFELMRIFW
jgi:hypothetical protein